MPQIKKLNLTSSFHINHILYYGDALKNDILGESRSEKILPINSFVQQKQPFSLHSDQPMYQCIPLLLLNTAVNRTSESGTVLGKEEKISVLEGLKALTIYAAWQFHCEDKLGSFVKNKYADMVMLDKNPLHVNPDEIKNINVLQTFVAGKSIFLKK
jgi:predicted amidohydrolase YtcJ